MSPSEQARADAMADAETLRLAWADARGGRPAGGLEARVAAPWSHAGWYYPPIYYRAAASAAFALVPGLRGDA